MKLLFIQVCSVFVAHLGARYCTLRGFLRVLGGCFVWCVSKWKQNMLKGQSICFNPYTSNSVLFLFCFSVFTCRHIWSWRVTLYFKNAIIKYTLFQSRRNDKLLHWKERCDAVEIWRRKYTWSDCKEWWCPIINNSLSLHGLCSSHVGVGHPLVDKLGTTSKFVDGWRWFACLCLNPQFESQVTNTIVN